MTTLAVIRHVPHEGLGQSPRHLARLHELSRHVAATFAQLVSSEVSVHARRR